MTDDVASRLVDQLEATGTPAESGEFTLDEAAALRKLAEYRLADRHDWLCLVVEAASLLETRKITIDSKRGELVVEFDGASARLEGLFGSVFAAGPEPSPSDRARRKLAIALQALVASEGIEQVTIADESGPLVIQPKGVRFEALGEGETKVRRTRLHVERSGRRWPELARVRERCGYASFDIIVDGEAVAFGLNHALDSVQADHRDRSPIHDQDRVIGWHGWRGGFPFPAELVLVCDGVLAETLPLDGTGDVVIVEGSFRKDVSEASVLRNESFHHVMTLVASHRARHARAPAAPPAPAPTPAPAPRPVITPEQRRAMYNRLLSGMAKATLLVLGPVSFYFFLSWLDPAPSTAPRTQPPTVLNGPLYFNEVSKGFAGTRPAIHSCGRQHETDLPKAIRFDAWIDGKGTVRRIQLASDLADTPLGHCIEAALRNAVFRTFDGEGSVLDQRARLRRDLEKVVANREGYPEELMPERRAPLEKDIRDLELVPATQLVHHVLEF